jgi:protein XagA
VEVAFHPRQIARGLLSHLVSATLPAARAIAGWVLVTLTIWTGGASAGAWLLPPGSGQIIAGAAFSGSSKAFDAHGHLIPVPYYKKFELGAYIEYGVTNWLTMVAAPAYDRIRQPPPAGSYKGLGESALGARVGLFRSDPLVLSFQAVLLTPGASFNNAFEPRRAGSIDLRGLAGYNFLFGSLPAFINAEAGYRFYAQSQPGEWRLDVTLGIRPLPQLLVLLQSFASLQTGHSAAFPASSWDKIQMSVVYDFTPAWSAQLGAFLTIDGVNAGREAGPMATIWYRF